LNTAAIGSGEAKISGSVCYSKELTETPADPADPEPGKAPSSFASPEHCSRREREARLHVRRFRAWATREALWSIYRRRKGRMKRRIAALLSAALVSMSGAAACSGVQDRLEKRAQDEVDKGRQRIEKEVQKGQKQVEEQIDKERRQVEKEVEKGRQQVEKRVQEEQQRAGEGQ
jgi:hypothetical protein